MRCEVTDCGATAVATVRQTQHCASPGAEHHACDGCARDALDHGLIVHEMHDDDIPWTGDAS